MTQEEKQLLLIDLCARLPGQEWRIIPDYPEYAVSNIGNIATIKTGKLRSLSNHKGYKQCMLRKDGKAYNRFVHRLVASAFLPAPEKGQVIDHINGIRNDNRVENLRWCSVTDNLHFPLARQHREHLQKPCCQYNLDGSFISKFNSSFEAGEKTGIACGSIDNCCKGKKLSAGGYQWRYAISSDNIEPIRDSERKVAVAQYREDNTMVAVYSSCREAARKNNLTVQVISECINGKRKTSYGGFIWKRITNNS